MNRRHVALLVVAGLGSTGLAAFAAGEKGWFGFAVSVSIEGFSFNPTLASITVQKVISPSPAASAGLAVGDLVLEVEGIAVAGAKGDTLKAAMQKVVGEELHLKVKRGAAEPQSMTLKAIAKPVGA
jgi:C-terminal processing protease CtpA/Prc